MRGEANLQGGVPSGSWLGGESARQCRPEKGRRRPNIDLGSGRAGSGRVVGALSSGRTLATDGARTRAWGTRRGRGSRSGSRGRVRW